MITASLPVRAAPTSQFLSDKSGRLALAWQLDGGALTYTVTSTVAGRAVEVVGRSPLGLTRVDHAFVTGLEYVSASPVREIDETYSMVAGKRLEIRNLAVERSYRFRNAQGAAIDLIVRAMDDGVAFRYAFPEGSAGALKVTGESTGFRMPADGVAWMLPYDRLAEWSPSYEMPWQNRIPVGKTAEDIYAGWAFPALFHVRDRWVMLTEAAMDGTCFGVHLEAEAPGGLYRVRLPEENETYGVAPQAATITLPWQSPWRVILVGETLASVVESDAITDLSAPCEIADTSWIKPGRVSWSWWSDKGSPSDYNRLVPFIDLSADMGWEYSLIDLGWENMKNGSVEMLADYAKRRGVGLILWYNSGGPHNQVYAGMRDRMHLADVRDAEMAWLARLGIKGIKVDFMQSDKQHVMQLYIDILRSAAKHKLFVDFHGATAPRGWARTFPNLLTQEGIRGAEQYWDPLFAENAHTYHTIYTFTRNVIGSMDYTPVIFGAAPELQWHKTTNAHELALSIAFESGLQHYVDSVAAYRTQPEAVQQMLKDVPASWDETRFVMGEPGRLSVLARRRSVTWFVAALNGLSDGQDIEIPLSFLGAGSFTATVIADGASQKEYRTSESFVTGASKLTVSLAGRGGCSVKLVPAAR